jgi:hypothetical protein
VHSQLVLQNLQVVMESSDAVFNSCLFQRTD